MYNPLEATSQSNTTKAKKTNQKSRYEPSKPVRNIISMEGMSQFKESLSKSGLDAI